MIAGIRRDSAHLSQMAARGSSLINQGACCTSDCFEARRPANRNNAEREEEENLSLEHYLLYGEPHHVLYFDRR